MSNPAIKTITVRIYTQPDADLIEMAIKKGGLSQSDWARNALLFNSELEIMNGGISGLTLKNILLSRRLIQIGGNYTKDQTLEAMEWSTGEFEKILNIKGAR